MIATDTVTDQQRLLDAAKGDPGIFLSYVFDFPLAAMHKAWLHGIMTHDRVLIVSPRAHAKTTTCSIGLPCWLIGLNPNIRIKVISGSDDQAKDIVFAIFKTIHNNPRYKEVFPGVQLATERESKWQIWVKRDMRHMHYRDSTVEALGVLSTAEGSRADVLILDDVITRRNCITPGMRTMVKEAYYNVHMNLLAPEGGRIIYIGTVWHREDLTVDLMYGDNDYNKQIYAIDADFTPLWPQVWPREKLIRRCNEITLRRFNMGFRNMPLSQDDYAFPEHLFVQCQTPDYHLDAIRNIAKEQIKAGKWRCAIGVDIAEGAIKTDIEDSPRKERRRAFNSIFVTVVDEHYVRIPVDIRRFKARSPETARILLDMYEEYRPEVILVEANNFGVIVDWMGEVAKLPLKTYFTDEQNKRSEDGVVSLQTEMRSGMWKFPQWSHPPACACDWCTWKSEVLSYPFGRFSDTVMSWWFSREAIRLHVVAKSGGRIAIWEY